MDIKRLRMLIGLKDTRTTVKTAGYHHCFSPVTLIAIEEEQNTTGQLYPISSMATIVHHHSEPCRITSIAPTTILNHVV